jgi:hypothetical protein
MLSNMYRGQMEHLNESEKALLQDVKQKEGTEPDYDDDDKDQLEEEQEEKTGETTKHIF